MFQTHRFAACKKVDLIIHAGDFCSTAELKFFQRIKQVRGVSGNMDGLDIRQVLPERDIFEIEGLNVGLVHGYGKPENVLSSVMSEFEKDKVDIVIFGHSHHPVNDKIDNVLYFNPGSPNDYVRAPYCSYGMLEINNGSVTGQIVRIKD